MNRGEPTRRFQMSSRIAPLPTPKPNPPKSAATRKARPSAMTKARASLMSKPRGTLPTKARALECAQDAWVLFPGEYSFVKRFRLRRLLAFLWLQGCCSTFFAMLRQTKVFFCVDYLARFVSNGQWTEALDYLVPRFLPPVPQSMEARILVLFLSEHRAIHLEVLRRQLPVDMRPVWAKSAGIVRDLANRTPELKDRLLLPAGSMGAQNVLPIGFGFAPFRRRWHVKKRRPKSSAIAKLYLHKRSSLPSSSHSNHELSPAEFTAKAVNWFQRIKKESTEVLIRPSKLKPRCELQSSVREGTPVTGNVINPECSSVPLTIDEGAPVAPVGHAMFGGGINSAENSAISSMAKTGGAAISQTMLGTGQEVCNTGSARQGSYPRKRPMTEQQEDYLDIKKQRTTRANGEASEKTLEQLDICHPHLQTKIAELLPVTK